jgi:hypothetical protein
MADLHQRVSCYRFVETLKKETRMLRSIAVSGTALMLILAGCDGGGNGKTATINASNQYVEQLKGLSEANRGLALRRAIQDAGQRCKRVESSGYQENYKNLSVWTARCSDGEWSLFIAPNGDVQVRSCKEVKTLGLPECRFDSKPVRQAAR